jgi:hypothetical protein
VAHSEAIADVAYVAAEIDCSSNQMSGRKVVGEWGGCATRKKSDVKMVSVVCHDDSD